MSKAIKPTTRMNSYVATVNMGVCFIRVYSETTNFDICCRTSLMMKIRGGFMNRSLLNVIVGSVRNRIEGQNE